jgi:protein transport protein SEC31
MATLCTYADESEFPDLCEALGDRLEEQGRSRGEASFCYLAGSKLEKVVPIWIDEMQEAEQVKDEAAGDESAFSIHVQALQHFIDKVSIFRQATTYEDKDVQEKPAEYRLEPLYRKYAEYADVVASYGHLDLAEQYLSLLPSAYGPAETARNRVQQAAAKKVPVAAARKQPAAALNTSQNSFAAAMQQPYSAIQPTAPANAFTAQPSQNSYPSSMRDGGAGWGATPQTGPSPYAPAPNAFANPYAAPMSLTGTSQPQPPQSKSGPPPTSARIMDGSNWNDLPDNFAAKPPTRRQTPAMGGPPTMNSPFLNQTGLGSPPPMGGPQVLTREKTPLPPPPKSGQAPPQFMAERSVLPPPARPTSAAANAYAPMPSLSQPQQAPLAPPLQRQVSAAYQPPPTSAPPSNRYTPAPGTIPTPAQPGFGGPPPPSRAIAPNPYAGAPPPGRVPQSFAPPIKGQTPMQGPPPPRAPASTAGPPPQGPPRGLSTGPPPASRPGTAQSQGSAAPSSTQYRKSSNKI